MTTAHLCPSKTFQGKTRSYSPLLQEALRARFTLVCEIEHRDQGSIVDASETCNSAAQNPNRHAQVDMPGDPRHWWWARCLEKVSSSHTSTTPTAPGSSETGSFCPTVGRKVAPQPAARPSHPPHTRTVVVRHLTPTARRREALEGGRVISASPGGQSASQEGIDPEPARRLLDRLGRRTYPLGRQIETRFRCTPHRKVPCCM